MNDRCANSRSGAPRPDVLPRPGVLSRPSVLLPAVLSGQKETGTLKGRCPPLSICRSVLSVCVCVKRGFALLNDVFKHKG